MPAGLRGICIFGCLVYCSLFFKDDKHSHQGQDNHHGEEGYIKANGDFDPQAVEFANANQEDAQAEAGQPGVTDLPDHTS